MMTSALWACCPDEVAMGDGWVDAAFRVPAVLSVMVVMML
jgi:hypothetical protein